MTVDKSATALPHQDDPQLVEKINKVSTVSAAMWMTVVGTLGILFLPLLVSGIIDELGFSNKQAGYVAAAEMAGVAIASGLGIFWVRRVNWVNAAMLATIIFIAANWVSTGVDHYWPIFVSRFLVGSASGALLAIGLACQSDSKNADRIFGYWVACQMTISTVGYIVVFPKVISAWGLDGFLFTLIALGLTSFVSIALLPRRGRNRITAHGNQQSNFLTSSVALIGALLFFMAQGGLWAFLERLGLAANLTNSQIGFALGISSILGILGGLAKNWLADAMGILSPFLFVIAGELVMLFLFATSTNNIIFAIAVCMLQFCWAMGMAAFLGGLNVIDKTGGLVLLLMSTAKVGYSLGPALMGRLIDGDDYTNVILASGLLVIVGMTAAVLLIKKRTGPESPHLLSSS